MARQGSGSACRSVHGGFVRWRMGAREDGMDSKAEVIEPASHWPNMHALILVASDGRKKVCCGRNFKTHAKHKMVMHVNTYCIELFTFSRPLVRLV